MGKQRKAVPTKYKIAKKNAEEKALHLAKGKLAITKILNVFRNTFLRKILRRKLSIMRKAKFQTKVNISTPLDVTGSVSLTNGAFYQDGVNLVDISLAYAIALG